MAPTTHQSIQELDQIHRQLEELFYRHQVAILQGQYAEAGELLEKYGVALFRHMQEEDEILLPLYREQREELCGGDPDIFTSEHKKIAEWVNRIKLRLQRLIPGLPDFRAVLALLDDEAHCKKFLEHHTLREDRIFYPELDRLLEDKDKQSVLRLLTFSLEEMADSE